MVTHPMFDDLRFELEKAIGRIIALESKIKEMETKASVRPWDNSPTLISEMEHSVKTESLLSSSVGCLPWDNDAPTFQGKLK